MIGQAQKIDRAAEAEADAELPNEPVDTLM